MLHRSGGSRVGAPLTRFRRRRCAAPRDDERYCRGGCGHRDLARYRQGVLTEGSRIPQALARTSGVAEYPQNPGPPPRDCRALLRRLVADDAIRQHDVTGPATRPAEAHEHAILPGPVLAHQPLAAISQRQRPGAPRAIPGRIPPVPLGVGRGPAPADGAARNNAGSKGRRHSAAAFLFSCALICSFFSASACGLNRDEARSMNWMANDPPASNLFFSQGRSMRGR